MKFERVSFGSGAGTRPSAWREKWVRSGLGVV